MLLGIPYLIALLILIGPFLVIGGQALIAATSWPDLIVRLIGERSPRQTSQGWAVATWA